ncbi:hypothetical protein FA13DRAFT_1732615 [Coprinellus micaceus]|uniref:Uncharacterized protein n=1 Tax=Coprinellus micaceus TaxID=71717 RepID=A0A4Y7TCS4_COPMI|nr:hypothetical protein FA13DRAFT_1732615 [Coprinellus micaceus]
MRNRTLPVPPATPLAVMLLIFHSSNHIPDVDSHSRFISHHVHTREAPRAQMPRYHPLPPLDPQSPSLDDDNTEYELETLSTTLRIASSHPQPSQGEKGALWWICVGLAFNAAIMIVNLSLSMKVESELALLKERPLSELPRPDPLYGVKNPG